MNPDGSDSTDDQGTQTHQKGRKTEYRLKERASIIWGLAVQRKHQAQVAREQQVSTKTVRKWHRRFLEDRVEGLEDAPRPGAPLTYDEALRCEVIAVACDQPAHYDRPEQTFWTYDTLIQVLPEAVE
ncbi:MAG: hypothetical protein K0S25_1524, partial [Bacillus sp. (in: firmicutes)]|nr:hypothetical protein [Bacillus sp. (in: firmicutes)]